MDILSRYKEESGMEAVATHIAWRLAAVLLGSFIVCAMVILTQQWHGRHSLDHDLSGAQKLHSQPVPRIGGLGLLFGLLVAAILSLRQSANYPTIFLILVCAMPVFLSGFVEDLTKRVGVSTRLIASFVSAGLAIWLLNARLIAVDTPILDTLLQYPATSVLFTIFAVSGATHSVNIIDGLNGLAAGTVSIILAGLAAISWMHGDLLVMNLCMWGMAAMIGFLILNYPFGRIFLGDGGAYLAGFWLAECAVLLLVRNPNVSTWAVLLACIYPIWETVFSIYRRSIVQRVSTGNPDFSHLHQLLYNAFEFKPLAGRPAFWRKHGLASLAIWGITGLCQIFAVIADDKTVYLFTCTLIFTLIYYWIYQSLSPGTDSREQRSVHTAKI